MRNRLLVTAFFAFGFVLLTGFKIELKGLKQKLEQAKRPASPPPAAAPSSGSAAREPAAATGLCNASGTNGICYSFTGVKHGEDKSKKGNQFACKLLKGQFSERGECPAPNRLGRCAILPGTPEEYHLVYYSGKKLAAGDAATDCANAKSGLHRHGAGAWTAGG